MSEPKWTAKVEYGSYDLQGNWHPNPLLEMSEEDQRPLLDDLEDVPADREVMRKWFKNKIEPTAQRREK